MLNDSLVLHLLLASRRIVWPENQGFTKTAAFTAPASLITLDKLVKVVCEKYQMDKSDLAVADRTHLASEARCVIGWLAQQYDQIALT